MSLKPAKQDLGHTNRNQIQTLTTYLVYWNSARWQSVHFSFPYQFFQSFDIDIQLTMIRGLHKGKTMGQVNKSGHEEIFQLESCH